ncbi:MAG: hypothetical protein ABI690_34665 [Chloroflexota bacterium]
MVFWKHCLMLGLLLILAVPVLAQDNSDSNSVLPIQYDDVVQETLTPKSFFDWWQVQAHKGDDIVIDMAAFNGLMPLIGILDSGGTLVSRSDDGGIDGTITLEYVIPADGQYTIVATRVGNADGTSTGSYSLRLRLANPPVETVNTYQDVTFRCDDNDVTTASTIVFQEDPTKDLAYRITVYGVDGFIPVIRLDTDSPNKYEVCNTDAQQTIGDTFTLPGEAQRTISQDNLNTVSQLLVNGADKAGIVTLTIGSKDGTPGRYMAIIEGFNIDPDNDTDKIEVRVGPLAAKTTAIQIYMVAAQNSRVDPFMLRPDTEETCDDAGRKGCEAVPTFAGSGATLHEGTGTTILGDRSDAGMLVNPGNPDPIVVVLSSREGKTHGTYALIFIGQLPPRDAS